MEEIRIKPSKQFQETLAELNSNCSDVPKNIQDFIKKSSSDSKDVRTLTTDDVRWCHSKLKECGITMRIHQLMEDSKIVLPECEAPPPRNPELEKRIQRLRIQQEEKQYQSMVKHLDSKNFTDYMGLQEANKEMREINKQLITGLQYLLSVVGTFFGMFFGIGYILVDYGPRVMLSIFAAIAVGLAELYFIVRDDIKAEAENNNNKPKGSVTKKSKPVDLKKIKQN